MKLRRQAVYDLLHRLDYSSLMPRPQHEQANPEVQEFFKEIVVEQIDAIAAGIPRSRFIPISRMKPASARRGRSHGSGRGGVRDRVRCGRRDSARSTCWRPSRATGAMSAVMMPTLNTEVVNLFLEQFSRVARRGACGADLGRGGLPHR